MPAIRRIDCARNPKVDQVLAKAVQWSEELDALRTLVLSCGLTETLKWGQPCYTLDGRNIVLIHGFKEYCALLFMKGALLRDPAKLLVQQTENVQSARQIRFSSLAEIRRQENILKSTIEDAIAVEKSGARVAKKTTADFAVPEELTVKFKTDAALKAAFGALTPGRQRGYLLHFSSAKQSATRMARIERCRDRILQGIGWNE